MGGNATRLSRLSRCEAQTVLEGHLRPARGPPPPRTWKLALVAGAHPRCRGARLGHRPPGARADRRTSRQARSRDTLGIECSSRWRWCSPNQAMPGPIQVSSMMALNTMSGPRWWAACTYQKPIDCPSPNAQSEAVMRLILLRGWRCGIRRVRSVGGWLRAARGCCGPRPLAADSMVCKSVRADPIFTPHPRHAA